MKKVWLWLKSFFVTPVEEINAEVTAMEQEVAAAANSFKRWAEDEEILLHRYWKQGYDINYIASALERSVNSIKRKLNTLGYSLKHDAPRVSAIKEAFHEAANQPKVDVLAEMIEPYNGLEPLRNAGRAWSDDDKQLLIKLFNINATIPQLQQVFGRTEASITAAIYKYVLPTTAITGG